MGNFIWFLLIGLVAGWLAGQISRGGGFGLWGDLIVGVIGAFVGGFIFSLMGITAYGLIGSLITATIGAVVLLWVMRLFTGKPAQGK
ncbi:MAG TPA: GlsB/YeaQ/YmgE family stress response membrane protein [Selenomonadales bacterium]|nr:GlsB/YeaQ/YmgE family stress response membrane protein [Selenomonadales bacterium]